ncbi:type III pantothenate kinase [Endozoicomonas sp. SM1973]|uniref:Type III pantothenate kinase n=1 Tax=Spartinivicinus marinus TaxID=2994442 RepID=A0A853I596_9GAMM|nr:type III pantothenate kinase [Spartinivicinus marinus]MCX4026311.1 type III pantothenate kinase [Spartinivicinus marinus]NYZ68513.1 type III pantothenate kinase [Spartinivicinus marinus]
MNRLEVDVGNTRIKWRYAEGGSYVAKGALDLSEAPEVAKKLRIQGVMPQQIIVANVAGEEVRLQLKDGCQRGWEVEPYFVKTQKNAYGIEVAYADVTKLGVDRWLAMLGCHHLYPSCAKVVVSLGSAITVDVIDMNGMHEGGYIVPGFRLMRESLRVSTAQVQVDSTSLQRVDLGKNTAEAVEHGMLKMVIAFIESVVVPLKPQNSEAIVVITGGDAAAIASSLTVDYLHEPELVLDGLALIAQ